MARRSKWLITIALVTALASLYIGCSQPDDVITPVSLTTLDVSAQMLFDAPEGMIYEMWVVKIDAVDELTAETTWVSLGKFGYSRADRRFLDPDGTTREEGGLFILEDDLFEYSLVTVTVETVDNDDPAAPGPRMLIDDVTDPSQDPIELVFPLSDSLWNSIVRYNMETTSDNNRNANDGYGLWLCSYQEVTRNLQDTVAFDSFVIDSEWVDELGGKTETTVVVDILNPSIVPMELILGLDTFPHLSFQWAESTETFTETPYLLTRVEFYIDTSNSMIITYDLFNQDDFGLIDYSDYGWVYRPWIVSPTIEAAGVSLGSITLPAWGFTSTGLDYLPGWDGGMISTGSFTKIEEPDDEDLYTMSARVPAFPGDEFFEDLPNGVVDPLNLVPNSGGFGTVFITLEPTNFPVGNTNFPLFCFVEELPQFRGQLAGDVQQYTMKPMFNTNDPSWGFPKMTVSIRRF